MRRLGVVAALAVAGCAPAVVMVRYERPNTSHEQFMGDRFDCLRASQKNVAGVVSGPYGVSGGSDVVVSRGLYISCMGAKGYSLTPNGQHAAPPGSEVRMID